MPTPQTADSAAAPRGSEDWVDVRVRVPRSWKVTLEEIAQVRALSVAGLVRQLIRGLIIQRHNGDAQ